LNKGAAFETDGTVSSTALVDARSTPGPPIPINMVTGGGTKQLTIVPGRVNAVEGKFLVDTGAHRSYLGIPFARSLGLPLARASVRDTNLRGLGITSIASLSIGGVQFHSGPMYVASMGSTAFFDGVLGMDVLARQPFSINYRTATLTLNPSRFLGDPIPVEYRRQRLYVKIDLDGVEITLPFDTGSTRNSVNKEQWNRLVANGAAVVTKEDVIASPGGVRRLAVDVLRIRKCTLGPFTAENIDFMQLERPALGVRYLEDCTLTVDATNNRMYFSKPKAKSRLQPEAEQGSETTARPRLNRDVRVRGEGQGWPQKAQNSQKGRPGQQNGSVP